MMLEEFISHVQDARRQGSGYVAKCPAHEDNKASLGINQAQDGKILLKCYAGCTFDAIVQELGIEKKELMGGHDFTSTPYSPSPSRQTVSAQPAKEQPTELEKEVVYSYRDELGFLLYQAVRLPGKKFTQRRPNPDGGWIWSVKDVRKVPYRLAEIRNQEGVVYIVEGEKDADRLTSLGLIATTNVAGAGKWTDELSMHLKDRDVVILPDNDEPGEDHAKKVEQSLNGIAKSVKIVRLPGLPPKGDVSDFLNKGKTLQDLLKAIEKTHVGPRIYTLQEAADSYLDSLAAGREQLYSLGMKQLDNAVGGGVASGEMIIIAARPSHGKSAMALQILDKATQEGHTCLMISEEMSRIAIGKRTVTYVSDIHQEDWMRDMENVKRQVASHFKQRDKCVVVESCGTVEAAADQIRRAVDTMGVKYVAVDYIQILGGKGSDTRTRINYTSNKLREVANETGVVLIALAQLKRDVEQRKEFIPLASDLKESGQLEQDADVILMACWPHRFDMKQPANEYLIFVVKNRNREIVKGLVKCDFIPSRQQFQQELPKNYNHDLAQFNSDSEW